MRCNRIGTSPGGQRIAAHFPKTFCGVRGAFLEETVQPPAVTLLREADTVHVELAPKPQALQLAIGQANEVSGGLIPRQNVHLVEVRNHKDRLELERGHLVVAFSAIAAGLLALVGAVEEGGRRGEVEVVRPLEQLIFRGLKSIIDHSIKRKGLGHVEGVLKVEQGRVIQLFDEGNSRAFENVQEKSRISIRVSHDKEKTSLTCLNWRTTSRHLGGTFSMSTWKQTRSF